MSETPKPSSSLSSDLLRTGLPSQSQRVQQGDKFICERCGQAEMFRMHAVWRCPHCGYKTDCCGW
jgi:ribosomal protein L37AE/L43A